MAATYFVRHGCAASLSCCSGGLRPCPGRREAGVIPSPRGPELGPILTEASADAPGPCSPGELLRRARAEDHRTFAELRRRGQLLLDDAHRVVAAQQLPLLPLDVDLTLDGAAAQI